jgi:hypothetical protein
MSERDLPDGWRVWNDDEGTTILVYRPDVFDTQQFPAPCLPTIRVTQRPPTERKRRAGSNPSGWFVSLRLEPEVRVKSADAGFETREAAEDGARDLAERFAAGDVDYRGAYQIPREGYLDELDALTGA